MAGPKKTGKLAAKLADDVTQLSKGLAEFGKNSTQSTIDFIDAAQNALLFRFRSSRKALDMLIWLPGFDLPRGNPLRIQSINAKALRDILVPGHRVRSFTVLKKGDYIEIDNTHSIWRDASGTGYIDTEIDNPIGKRGGFERDNFSAREMGKAELVGMQRLHPLGQGTGFEFPFFIYLGPKFVNQELQNKGIEATLRGLNLIIRDGSQRKLGAMLKVTPHTGTNRLQEIIYNVYTKDKDGGRDLLFEYKITVGKNPPFKVDDAITSVYNPQASAGLIKELANIETLLKKHKLFNEKNIRVFQPNDDFLKKLERAIILREN
ncbi:MAG: polymorphic toxin type 4 domain-containing protein [Desulfocapsaceae bacterium]|nr:polymorphic toxin type 4 domain-containing protein [Desulfocapsaceae bacterium]